MIFATVSAIRDEQSELPERFTSVLLRWRFRGNDFFGPVVAKRVAEKRNEQATPRRAETKGLKENATRDRQGPDTLHRPAACICSVERVECRV